MANINKIKLSGTTYNIEDLSAAKSVELTQAQYDALVTGGTVDPNTFYIITDAQGADLSQYYTSAQTESAITQAVSGKVDNSTYTAYTAATDSTLANKQTTLTAGTGINITDNVISATGGGASYSAGTGIDITNDVISVTGKVDTSTFNTYSGSVETALSGKQDTLSAGTNITIVDNVISAEGGGKAVTGGTNISVTTGTTADTINCTLPISKGSGKNNSLILGTGNGNTASGQYSIAVGGRNNSSSKYCSLVGGNENNVSNEYETSFGNSNVTNYASTTFGNSGNTLFSVGNGSNYNFRHNAFEIRQDGSIYIPDLSNGTNYRDRPMIKLQDALGGGGASYSAGTGIDITNDVISVTGMVDTATFNTYSGSVDTALSGKQDTLSAGTGIEISGNVISATGGGGSITIDPSLDSGSTNAVANSAITQNFYNYAKFAGNANQGYVVSLSSRDSGNAIAIDGTKIKTTANGTIQNSVATWLYISTINGKKAVSSSSSNTKDFTLVETSAITSSITSSSTDAQVPSAKAVYDQLGGLKLVKLTQSAYDALSPDYDSNTLYIIKD